MFCLFSTNWSSSAVSVFPTTSPLFCFIERKRKTRIQKTISTFCLGCCVYVIFLLFLFFVCLYFSCVFGTVTVLGLLMLLMFVTTCLKFYFPYCSFCISKTTLIKNPRLYCPFCLVCHWDSTQMTLRKCIVTMRKIQQQPVIMRLIWFISWIMVPLLFCCQCCDYFLFMCSANLLRWFWVTERIFCECVKLDENVCSLWLFTISRCQYNVPHFI